MILTFCLDSNGGMTFNGKRQTQDVVHRERLLALAITKNCRLIMNSYSGKLFGCDAEIDDDIMTEEFLFHLHVILKLYIMQILEVWRAMFLQLSATE